MLFDQLVNKKPCEIFMLLSDNTVDINHMIYVKKEKHLHELSYI